MFTLLHSILLSTTTERNFCSFEELIKRNKGFLVATSELKKKYCSCTHLYNNARERTRLSLVKVPIFPWQFPSYGNYCSLRVKAVKKELHFCSLSYRVAHMYRDSDCEGDRRIFLNFFFKILVHQCLSFILVYFEPF